VAVELNDVVGRDCCASRSGILMLGFFSCGSVVRTWCWPVRSGGLVSLTCGMKPAMDVSGIPLFRGGGSCGSRL